MKLQRPILVGGLGLSFSLWFLQSWHDSVGQLGELSLLSLIAVGGGLWLLKYKRAKAGNDPLDSIPTSREIVEEAIAKSETVISFLAQEAENHPSLADLRAQAQDLYSQLDRENINVAVTGGKSVGKTTLIQTLQPHFPHSQFQETSPLLQEVNQDTQSLIDANQADFVLFLTNGDLTDSEYQALHQVKATSQRAMLVFNKQDQYLPEERASIFLSLQQRFPQTVATAASPLPIKVRKHGEDGSIQEWMEQPVPDTQQIIQQLGGIISNQGQQLVWATTQRQALLLQATAKEYLNGVRSDRATPVIEQYQWIAAAAAFANPLPALDLLATAAINGQMVVDLGHIYQQKFSLEQAKTVAGEMGSLMLKLGLVELSTKAIGTVLKTNAITYVAGGVVEGVSAAYLTRLAGLSLIAYFQEQEIAVNSGSTLNLDKLRQTIQNVFQENQKTAFIQTFVQQGVKRLLPETTDAKLITAENAAV
ncbi:YcjF family protein [Calothrix sp. 336/3]|uniref:YcjF family protein n=1 Tax=Calothrix sp. 336/3 TaxID=1337936 RepID=UPI000A6C5319|nr:DUF697 domain-containing protein [Calothrix sp. 336/3]